MNHIVKYKTEKYYCTNSQSVYLMSMTDCVIQQNDWTKKQIYNTLMMIVLYSDISQINKHKFNNAIILYDTELSITEKLR